MDLNEFLNRTITIQFTMGQVTLVLLIVLAAIGVVFLVFRLGRILLGLGCLALILLFIVAAILPAIR